MIYLGIDWSGAERYQGNPLQVAVATDTDARALILPPPEGERRWTRTGALSAMHFLYREMVAVGERAVVGLDFSFAFPFVDQGGYFPGDTADLPDAYALWARVDEICADAPDCYAGPLIRHPHYGQYFLRPGFTGARYAPRLRVTEQCCAIAPNSVFNLIGPRTVGVGSLAGMRWLRALLLARREGTIDFCLWPFEPVRESDHVILAEVYPRLCRQLLGNPPMPEEMPAHQRDALFAAHLLKLCAKIPDCWSLPGVPEEVIRTEGWILGVPGNG